MGCVKNLSVNVKLKIDEDTRLALEQLAQAGDRTVAAEMRRALRAHIRANQQSVEVTR